MSEEFEPKILAFCCNWCSYAGADLAGTSRIQYPPNVRIIRLMCSVRGIGVAERTRVCGALPRCRNFARCSTPKRCCSSITTKPKSLNETVS